MRSQLVIGACTVWACEHPIDSAVIVVFGVIHLGFASRTARIASRLNRSEFVWLFYGLVLPIVSYVLIKIVQRRESAQSDQRL
jgi:hypothetical protein